MEQKKNGYIVVETIGCFLLFVFLNISILSLINIVTVQTRIHYALTQAAETLSMYSYILEATGVADHLVNSAEKSEEVVSQGEEVIGNINTVIASLESLDIEELQDSAGALYDQASGFMETAKNNPQEILQGLLNYGIQGLSSAALGACVQPLVGWYLTNGDQSGDEYLQAAHVIGGLGGLDFYTPDSVSFDTDSHQLVAVTDQTSRFLDSGENIKLVVQYKIDYTFGALPLPGFSELEVTQEVMTKAWLNGDKDGYQG